MNDELLALADRLKNAGLNFGDQSDPCSLKVTVPERDTIVSALRLAAQSPEPVTVKPLVWVDHRPDSFPEPAWSAQTPFGFYNIEEVSASDCPAYVVRLHAHRFVADKDSLDAAKAAAQADYEQRIRSALVNVPMSASDGALREALEQIRTVCIDNAGDTVRHDLALKFIGKIASRVLAASEATKSDGGLTPNATTIAAIEELERGGGEVGTGYGEFTPVTVRGSTSDPSSTRSEVTALADIAKERQRQRDIEGWTVAHDDGHDAGEMASAAACYALSATGIRGDDGAMLRFWPWDDHWWKPTNRRRDLIKAGALIVAEIERLDRLDQFEIRRK